MFKKILIVVSIFSALSHLAVAKEYLPIVVEQAKVQNVQAPQMVIQGLSDLIILNIRENHQLKTNKNAAMRFIEQKVVVYFDFYRTTALAVGLPWHRATSQDKKNLSAAFRELLVRTYVVAFSQYSDQTLKILSQSIQGNDALVKSLIVNQSGDPPISVDYRLYFNGQNWRIYDVSVAGVSLVLNYRHQFQEKIRQSGFGGLIAILKQRNSQLDH